MSLENEFNGAIASVLASHTVEDQEDWYEEMNWVQPKYTKGQIKRAGKHLAANPDCIDYEALEIVNNWRASHAYSLNSAQSSLRYRMKDIDPDGTVGQRLKRLPSIIKKLQRIQGMQLSRMQDIGGCRAIVSDLKKVYELKDSLLKSFPEDLTERNDYIKNCKPDSGYRGIHLTMKYGGSKAEYKGLSTEIQLRTRIQHAWATAVEIIGTFTKQDLKSGEGNSEWLEFFKITSILFAEFEQSESITTKFSENDLNEMRKEAIRLADNLAVVASLRTFHLLSESLEEFRDKIGYFILSLDVDSKKLKGFGIEPKNVQEATQKYMEIERDNRTTDVVLVKAESISELRKGYPNYFADSKLFQEVLDKVLQNESRPHEKKEETFIDDEAFYSFILL